jgi:hypothetical protein
MIFPFEAMDEGADNLRIAVWEIKCPVLSQAFGHRIWFIDISFDNGRSLERRNGNMKDLLIVL